MSPFRFFLSLALLVTSLSSAVARPTCSHNGHCAKKCHTTPTVTPTPVPKTTPDTTPTPETTPTTTHEQATPTPSSPTGGNTSDSDIQTYLSAHNDMRAKHGAAPLTWSNELASKAQQWADGCVFKHSGGSLGPYGENLAAGTGDFGIDAAIGLWTAEDSQYDASNPQPSHFTQVVWKGTSQVGCAVQSCSGIFDASFGKAEFYVCEYFAAGNVIGQFSENVQA